MTLQLTLPAELEDRLRREAQRQGIAPDAVTLKLLEEHLPPTDATATLPGLFRQWQIEDESAPDGNAEDDDFFKSLDAARTSNRKLFPSSKGSTPGT